MMKRYMRYCLATLLGAMCLISTSAFATTVWATVSKNKVSKNEVFQLRVVVDEKVSSDAIDFTSLENQFYLGRPSFGSSVNIINGDRSTRSEWNISLAAHQLGMATIPAFEVSGAKSQPIAIQVTVDQDDPKADDLIELQANLDKTQLYPNESAYLKTRLIIKADPRRLQNPQITPPSINGMTLDTEGEPNQYQSVLDGMEVTVVDQTYRITADQAGQFMLRGPSFKGTVIYGSNRTGTTKLIPVITKAKQFDINVESKPESYKGTWLPTASLQLTQQWHDAEGNLINPVETLKTKVGDSISREITLDIAGLASERFPNIKLDYPSSVRVYDEKPKFTELDNGVTRMTVKQVLIPQKQGETTLPDVTINWWNSQSKKAERNKLAGLALDIAPGEVINTPLSATTPSQPAEVKTVTVKDSGYWPYLTALFATLWLLTGIYALKRSPRSVNSDEMNNTPLETETLESALQSLKNKDFIRAQHFVDLWLKQNPSLDPKLKQEITEEVAEMQRAQYASGTASWNEDRLIKKLTTARKQHVKMKPSEKELPSL